MSYTLSDIDWTRFAGDHSWFKFSNDYDLDGYPFAGFDASLTHAEDTVSFMPYDDEIYNYLCDGVDASSTVYIYKEPENASDEVEDIMSMMDGAEDDVTENVKRLKELGVNPVKVIEAQLIMFNQPFTEANIEFDGDAGIRVTITGWSEDTGGYNADMIMHDGQEVDFDKIAKDNGGDCAASDRDDIHGVEFKKELPIIELEPYLKEA